jgi:hypothetical protein
MSGLILNQSLKNDGVIITNNQLRKSCTNINDINIKAILDSFQNVAYIGVLRQRWEEIQKLIKGEKLAIVSN